MLKKYGYNLLYIMLSVKIIIKIVQNNWYYIWKEHNYKKSITPDIQLKEIKRKKKTWVTDLSWSTAEWVKLQILTENETIETFQKKHVFTVKIKKIYYHHPVPYEQLQQPQEPLFWHVPTPQASSFVLQ